MTAPAEFFQPGCAFWFAGRRWRAAGFDSVHARAMSLDGTVPPKAIVLGDEDFGQCRTADQMAADAPAGPWSYRMSPFHTEAVIESPGGMFAHLRQPDDFEQPARGRLDAAVHLMAHGQMCRSALAVARGILAAGGADAATQALAVLTAAPEN